MEKLENHHAWPESSREKRVSAADLAALLVSDPAVPGSRRSHCCRGISERWEDKGREPSTLPVPGAMTPMPSTGANDTMCLWHV